MGGHDLVGGMVSFMCGLCWGGGDSGGVRAFFFQAEDGIRDLVRSRGLGDVYKRQALDRIARLDAGRPESVAPSRF